MIDPSARRKLRETIAALTARTTDRGCTEAEALAAAEKVAELLAARGLSDLADLEFDEIRIAIGRRTVIDRLWGVVGQFAHCKTWYLGHGQKYDIVYFGRWGDVQVAEYLHHLLDRQIRAAVRDWQRGPEYKRRRTARTKREATKAFVEGMVTHLMQELWGLQWRRFPQVGGIAEHRALVLAPIADVEREMERRGVELVSTLKPVKSAGRGFGAESASGSRAASGIAIHAPVNGAQAEIAGLLE
jgi:hypothetical protein